MVADIKNSMERPETVAKKRQDVPFPETVIPVKQQRGWAKLSAFSVLSILGIGLAFSVKSDYLFFRELLLVSSIFGMGLLIKALQRPKVIISRADSNAAHLN